MPTFRYDKLVRDNIAGFHNEAGHTVKWMTLAGAELREALFKKLYEEADEARAATDKDDRLEELADLQQIINDLCYLNGSTRQELDEAAATKKAKKGGFLQGVYIETVKMHDEHDRWAAYCRAAPDKYPEL